MAVGNFYYAYVDEGTPFDPGTHNREDETVFAFRYLHSEGDFAQMEFDIRNPRVGLLNAGRKLWVWFSVETSAGVTPVFYGRIVGLPTNIFAEVVTITFTARPVDFNAQKIALAETLRVAPYWDPVFIDVDRLEDPDVVLESRPCLWHSDPVTHQVTISNVVDGEDGAVFLGENDYLYEDMSLTLGQSPATTIVVKTAVGWNQEFKHRAFGLNLSGFINSVFARYKLIESFTMQGLIGSWPKQDQQYGSYFVMTSEITDVSFSVWPPMKPPDWFAAVDPDPSWNDISMKAGAMPQALSHESLIFLPKISYNVTGTDTEDGGLSYSGSVEVEQAFAVKGWATHWLVLGYSAIRKYTESLTIVLRTSVQPIVTEPGDDDRIELTINGNTLSDLIGAEVPIGDLGSRKFFEQERGKDAIRYLLCCARAALMMKARAVEIEVALPMMQALALEPTLRKNLTINNARLPGGVATGKIVGIKHGLDGDQGLALSSIRMACVIGRGEGPYSPVAGSPTYGELAYMGGDYQQLSGAVNIIADEIPDLAYTVDPYDPNDDGLDPRAVAPKDLVIAFGIQNPASDQLAKLASLIDTIADTQEVNSILQEYYTQIDFELRKLDTGPFNTDVTITVEDLVLPKQIDLEA